MKINLTIEITGDFEKDLTRAEVEEMLQHGAESCYADCSVYDLKVLDDDYNHKKIIDVDEYVGKLRKFFYNNNDHYESKFKDFWNIIDDEDLLDDSNKRFLASMLAFNESQDLHCNLLMESMRSSFKKNRIKESD